MGSRKEEYFAYISSFETNMQIHAGQSGGSALVRGYNFEWSIMDENDYICILTQEGKAKGDGVYGKKDAFTVFLFDVQTNKMFCFRQDAA